MACTECCKLFCTLRLMLQFQVVLADKYVQIILFLALHLTTHILENGQLKHGNLSFVSS